MVRLGPAPPPLGTRTLCPMLKEISKRNGHCDLIVRCRDGQVQVHSAVMAAQSKFLKGVLGDTWGRGHILEINLPSVRVLHLKRAVKFMYTGQLKMTKSEIDKDHLVWHVNHILLHLFRVDAKLNLPPHLLVAPASDGEDDEEGGDGGEADKSCNGDKKRRTSRTQRPSLQQSTYCGPASEDKGRQNARLETSGVQKSVPLIKECKENPKKIDESKEAEVARRDNKELGLVEKERRLLEERAGIARELKDELEEIRNDSSNRVQEAMEENETEQIEDRGKRGSQEDQGQDDKETPKENSQESTKLKSVKTPAESSVKIEDREDDEVVEVEQERVPTPDIVDLLDSDDDEKQDEGSLEEEVDRKGREMPIPEAPKLLPRERNDSSCQQNLPDILIPKAPRLIPRKGSQLMMKKTEASSGCSISKQLYTSAAGDGSSTSTCSAMPSTTRTLPSPTSSPPPFAPGSILPSPRSPVMLARKHSGPRRDPKRRRGRTALLVNNSISVPLSLGDPSEEERPRATLPANVDVSVSQDTLGQAMEMAGVPGPSQSMSSSTLTSGATLDPQPHPFAADFGNIYGTPSQSHSSRNVYRGRVGGRGSRGRSKPTKGVRKHVHVPWTMTGLRKTSTIATVKQEPAVHECEECGVKYDKYRSLEIHRQRAHNARSKVECPEGCGKLLSTTAAIRKHLLSHRPEEEWPHACPLCGKRFQARGDIPKHLMTSKHADDNIPAMGSKEWFDLIYWDDPKYNYAAMKVKLEKQESKGYVRKMPGTLSGLGPCKPESQVVRNEPSSSEVEIVEEVRELKVPVVQAPTHAAGVPVQPAEGEVEAVLGLEDQNFVLLDPNIDPLESVFLPMDS